MLHKKRLLKKKETSILKQRESLEFLITTFLISLLTILGVFMSHHNKDKLFSENRGISTSVISNDSIYKKQGIVSINNIDATFEDKMVPDSDINETLSNTDNSPNLVAFHPYFGQDQRSIESWSTSTVGEGLALIFGRGLSMSAPVKVVDLAPTIPQIRVENKFPEERCYNSAVINDILPKQ